MPLTISTELMERFVNEDDLKDDWPIELADRCYEVFWAIVRGELSERGVGPLASAEIAREREHQARERAEGEEPWAPPKSLPDDCVGLWPAARLVSARPFQWINPATIPARRWVYGRQLLAGQLSTIIAAGGTGKTSLTVGMALAIVTGRPLLGQAVWSGAGRVWIWSHEERKVELDRMVMAAALHWRLAEEDIAGRLFVNPRTDKALALASYAGRSAEVNSGLIAEIADELRDNAIDWLVVDPFVATHGLDENDNPAIFRVAKAWEDIADRSGAAITMVHHTRKDRDAKRDADANSARGAGALIDAARGALVLNRMSDEEGARLGIGTLERRAYFRSYDDKPNRTAAARGVDWYRLASVSLGNEGPAGPDEIGVAVPWSPTSIVEAVGSDALAKVRSALAVGEWRHSAQADRWAGNAVATVLGLDPSDDRARIKRMLTDWIKLGALAIEDRRDTGRRETKTFVIVPPDAAPPCESGAVQTGAAVR